jgi:hypothetical protein
MVSPGSLLSGTRLSYGASAVARTSDRGRVAEDNQCIEVDGALNQGFPVSPLKWRPMMVPRGD